MEIYPAYTAKYKHTAGLLGIFGGTLGLHNFYLGNRDKAVTQLLIAVLGGLCCGIGPIVTFIWGLVEGIQILTGTITTDGQGKPIVNPDYAAHGSKSKIVAGFLAMFTVAYLYNSILKLQTDGTLRIQDSIGQIGKVYLTVPAKGKGVGKVNVLLQERYVELEAITEGAEPINSEEMIRIVGCYENTVIVEKYS